MTKYQSGISDWTIITMKEGKSQCITYPHLVQSTGHDRNRMTEKDMCRHLSCHPINDRSHCTVESNVGFKWYQFYIALFKYYVIDTLLPRGVHINALYIK